MPLTEREKLCFQLGTDWTRFCCDPESPERVGKNAPMMVIHPSLVPLITSRCLFENEIDFDDDVSLAKWNKQMKEVRSEFMEFLDSDKFEAMLETIRQECAMASRMESADTSKPQ